MTKSSGFARDAVALSGLLLLSREPGVEDEISGQSKSLKAQAIAVCDPCLCRVCWRAFDRRQAVFVGAIQTQALTFSIDKNETNLQTATNVFFFVGILFNVVGAYYALMSASSLEADNLELESIFRGMTDAELADATRLPLSPLASRIVKHRYSHRTGIWDVPSAHDDGEPHPTSQIFDNTPLERLCHSILANRHSGLLGVAVIALGFISCPIAFLCLVQDSQPLAVKIVTLTVIGILFSLRVVVQYVPRRRV
jgi:hypothetical protein